MTELSGRQKKDLARIIISMVLFVAVIIMEHRFDQAWIPALYIIPYLLVGYDVIRNCFHGIIHGQVFDECFLMTLATVGAIGCKEYTEAVAVMLFYSVGEFFQSYAVGKSRNAISELMSIAPEYACLEPEDGVIVEIDPEDVDIGDILVVRPGEKIPVDGIVIEGEGTVNTSALTGESMPVSIEPGDDIISGCINGESLIRIQACKTYEDSTVVQILELVESATSRKSVHEQFITRFARYYTPIVVICGVLLAFVPPIFTKNFGEWILRACTFLVISCPCALVISVPLAFFGGIGAASRIGVLVKGSNYLEMMSQVDTLVTDKTGTLTEGRFRVASVITADGYRSSEVIRYAAAVEALSTHPLAEAVVNACDKPISAKKVTDVENVPGKGIRAMVGRHSVAAGNAAMMREEDAVSDLIYESRGTVIYVALDGKCIGAIEVADAVKENAASAVRGLLSEGVRHVVMLTGDSEDTATKIADETGITEYRAGMLPQNKVESVEEMIDAMQGDPHKRLVYVGDGINDAPVLARSDVGIAMGSLGSDAAIEAADIVVMDDDLSKLPKLIRISRKTVGISKANIAFALAVKFSCLVLGALGIANMWVAVFADVGVAMICILNSMRMLVTKSEEMMKYQQKQ